MSNFDQWIDSQWENYIMVDVEMEIAREVQPPFYDDDLDLDIDPEDVELEKLSELKAEKAADAADASPSEWKEIQEMISSFSTLGE